MDLLNKIKIKIILHFIHQQKLLTNILNKYSLKRPGFIRVDKIVLQSKMRKKNVILCEEEKKKLKRKKE